MRSPLLEEHSIARRLFLSAAIWIVVILGLAGALLSAYYRTTA